MVMGEAAEAVENLVIRRLPIASVLFGMRRAQTLVLCPTCPMLASACFGATRYPSEARMHEGWSLQRPNRQSS